MDELVISPGIRTCGSSPHRDRRRTGFRRIEGLVGWRFSLQAPSYMAVMTYLDDRAMREKAWHAYNTRAASGSASTIVRCSLKILGLRNEKARLLGFRDFADLVLDDRMAHTGDRAQAFHRRASEENRKTISRGESGARRICRA